MTTRPPFIVAASDVAETTPSYPASSEELASRRAIGKAAGLMKIGLHLLRIEPGQRTSWPHAEEKEVEFVLVLEGEVQAWVDGNLYSMRPGDIAAFPAGTGICHTFINNGERDARVLVGGERDRSDNRIYYPLHPGRQHDMPWSHWWDDIPLREQGPHDGLPDALRGQDEAGTPPPVR